eukprot:gene45124-44978_t
MRAALLPLLPLFGARPAAAAAAGAPPAGTGNWWFVAPIAAGCIASGDVVVWGGTVCGAAAS